ncbi:hypothetical protein, partial [Kitasatospora albolonga]|uniref:hypothetical protein n=1 Tax=Kitasatospora albolonga TaxID=68173 RepID=UPI0031ECBE35
MVDLGQWSSTHAARSRGVLGTVQVSSVGRQEVYRRQPGSSARSRPSAGTRQQARRPGEKHSCSLRGQFERQPWDSR